jgi:hypothetical protein
MEQKRERAEVVMKKIYRESSKETISYLQCLKKGKEPWFDKNTKTWIEKK